MKSHQTAVHALILVLSILPWIETIGIKQELYQYRNCFGKRCDYNRIKNNNEYRHNIDPFNEPESGSRANYAYQLIPENNDAEHDVEETSVEEANVGPSSTSGVYYNRDNYNNNIPWISNEENSEAEYEDSPVIPPGHSRNGYILSPNIFEEQLGDASEYIPENLQGDNPNSEPSLPTPRREGSLIYYVGFPNQIQYSQRYTDSHTYPQVSENRFTGEQKNVRDGFRISNRNHTSKLTDEAKRIPKLPTPRSQELKYQELLRAETESGTVPHTYNRFKDFQGVSKTEEPSSTNAPKLTASTYSPRIWENLKVESPVHNPPVTTASPHFLRNPLIIPTSTTLSPMEVYYMYKANPTNPPQNFGGYQFSTFGNIAPNEFNYLNFGGGGFLNPYGLVKK